MPTNNPSPEVKAWLATQPKPLKDYEIEKALMHISPEKLGAALQEYFAETLHNAWDGWPKRDITGARALLRDLLLAIDAGLPSPELEPLTREQHEAAGKASAEFMKKHNF